MNTMRPPAPRCLPANKAKAAITPACPCIIGANGVEEVLSPTLTESEQAKFHASCEHIRANIAQLAWWDDECHPMLRG